MTLACVGISHHSAPTATRERAAFTEAEIRAALPSLKTLGVAEGVLFSDPSRTELYVYSDHVDLLTDSLIYFLRQKKGLEDHVSPSDFFSYSGKAVPEHLFTLAGGIDSMIVGDNDAFRHVRTGFSISRELELAGPVLTRLFESSFRCNERVLKETMISEGAISVSQAAVELALHIFDQLRRKKILILGGGETVQLMGQHLVERGIGGVFVAHASIEKSEAIARSLGGTAVPFESYREKLQVADIVVSSLQAAPFVLSKQDIKTIDRMRQRGALLLIDLGMPRNIDPFATELEQVFLYDLDTLNVLVGENIARRRAEVPKVHSIAGEELARLLKSGKPWNQFQQQGSA